MVAKFVLIWLFAHNVQAASEIDFDTVGDCTRTARAVMQKHPELPYDTVPFVCVSSRLERQTPKLFLDRL